MTPHNATTRLGTPVAILTLALVGALTTACSGSASTHSQSTTGAAGAAGTAPAGNAATGSANAAGSAGGSAQATCSHVTAAQVQPLLTATITNTTVANVPDQVSATGLAQQCTFAVSDSAQAIVITVVGGADADGYFTGQAQSITPAAVSGIGQKAVRDKGDGTSDLTAEDNGVACNVSASSAGRIPGVAALEEAAGGTSNIGDANYAAISTALGTLCNRVFGSGNTTPDLSALVAAGAAASANPATDGGGLPSGLITS